MRKEGNLILGTIEEVVREIYKPNEKNRVEQFTDCDFAIVNVDDLNDEYTLEEIYDNSTGWYGIKEINPGFDSNEDCLNLIVDYYGGGCGEYCQIVREWADESDIDIVVRTILESLSYQEVGVNRRTVIIGELEEI